MGDTGLDVQAVARQVSERVKNGHEDITLPCVVLEDLIRIAQIQSLLTRHEAQGETPPQESLVQRLRGIYAVGRGDPPEFGFRQFDNIPAIQREAADRIEQLERELSAKREGFVTVPREHPWKDALEGTVMALNKQIEQMTEALQAASKLLAKANREQSYSLKELDDTRQLVHQALYERAAATKEPTVPGPKPYPVHPRDKERG